MDVQRLTRGSLHAAAGLAIVLLSAQVARAAPDACALVPQAEVNRILGNDAPIKGNQPAVEAGGATSSECYYQPLAVEGMNGGLQVQTFASEDAAKAGLKSFIDRRLRVHAAVQADTVAERPAMIITMPGGPGQIWTERGRTLIAAGVNKLQNGKATPDLEKTRLLLVAALKAL